MTANKFILAIDHGTSGVKSALMTARGELVGFEYEPTPIYFGADGKAEQDPEDWWRALVKTAQRLTAKRLVPVEDIAAVCCSSTFSSTVAVDSAGRHLGNSLTWMDSRGAPYIKDLVKGFPSVAGYNLFLALPWIRKTGGGPSLSGKDDIAHVLWWKHQRPEIYQKARWFLGSKDYLNLRLTGRAAASYDSIMLFWITDTRDIRNVRYDHGLIKKLGVEREKFPPLKSSLEVLGALQPEVADKLGLGPEVKVIMGSPDHQSAGIGSGAVQDFQGHVYIGTSSWIQCIVPFKKTDLFHSIASLPTAIPGKYYCANEQDVAGGVLPFFIEKFLYPRSPVNPAAAPEDIYLRLEQAASEAGPGSGKLIFAPWLNGERTPVDDMNLRGGLYNLSVNTTPAEIARSFFEGVALNTRWALGYVEKFIGRPMDPLNIIGGGARSERWCRIFADALNREIRQVRDPVQSNARGAAFIASVALGWLAWNDIPDLVPFENIFKPDPSTRKIYDELFAEFLMIYQNNRAMFRRLNQI